MLNICIQCHSFFNSQKSRNIFFCTTCTHLISDNTVFYRFSVEKRKSDTPIEAWVLYSYQKEIRDLIIRAKVKSDFRALEALYFLASERVEISYLMDWADAIVPAPSSLWGRLRGRFDIASFLAHRLANKYGKKVINPPWWLFWRLRKRALEKASKRRAKNKRGRILPEGISDFFEKIFDTLKRYNTYHNSKLVIVDDVVTTGLTLTDIVSAMDGCQIRCLALSGNISSSNL